MPFLQFNESDTIEMLRRLSPGFRVAFALLSSFRILPTYRRFHAKTGRGDPATLESTAAELWRDITQHRLSDTEIQMAAARCMELVPSEQGWDEDTQPYAEDAAAAVAYAVRARLNGDPQEAAWAGRRVYEAIDHFINAQKEVSATTDPDDQLNVLAHPLVQAELLRQQRDLHELGEMEKMASPEGLEGLRERSVREAGVFFGGHQ